MYLATRPGINIVHEDDEVLVINKPSGLPSAPHLSKTQVETAASKALEYMPKLQEIGTNPLEAGLVHRLDTGTSGLLVFAKTKEEYYRLKQAWKKKQVQKIYRAWVYLLKPLPPLPALLNWSLAHNPKSSKKMITLPSKFQHLSRKSLRSWPAITKLVKIHNEKNKMLDIEVQITTGVMHQIRCHLAAIETPILGDTVYLKNRLPFFSRLYLHAWKISLPLEKNKSFLSVEAELPCNWKSPH